MSCVTTAEAIQMPFGIWTRVGPRNHVLDGGPDHPMRKVQVLWERTCQACPTTLLSACLSITIVSSAKMAELIEMPFGIRTLLGPRNHILDGAQIPQCEEAIFRGKRRPIVKYRDCLPCTVQKQLNRLTCHLEHELE